MRLSQATAKARTIPVTFEGGDLSVTYRPASYTVAELDDLQADARNTARIVESMLRTLVGWELEYEPDAEDPLLDEQGEVATGIIPLTKHALTNHVPTSVFVVIMRAMQEDQSAGEAGAPSGAS